VKESNAHPRVGCCITYVELYVNDIRDRGIKCRITPRHPARVLKLELSPSQFSHSFLRQDFSALMASVRYEYFYQAPYKV
jgi:hypothetical protein